MFSEGNARINDVNIYLEIDFCAPVKLSALNTLINEHILVVFFYLHMKSQFSSVQLLSHV